MWSHCKWIEWEEEKESNREIERYREPYGWRARLFLFRMVKRIVNVRLGIWLQILKCVLLPSWRKIENERHKTRDAYIRNAHIWLLTWRSKIIKREEEEEEFPSTQSEKEKDTKSDVQESKSESHRKKAKEGNNNTGEKNVQIKTAFQKRENIKDNFNTTTTNRFPTFSPTRLNESQK